MNGITNCHILRYVVAIRFGRRLAFETGLEPWSRCQKVLCMDWTRAWKALRVTAISLAVSTSPSGRVAAGFQKPLRVATRCNRSH